MKKNLMIFLPKNAITYCSSGLAQSSATSKVVLKLRPKRLIHVQKINTSWQVTPTQTAPFFKKIKAYPRPQKGLTLIEALVAIIVFSIGLLGMIKLLSVSSRLQNNMEYQLQANLIASNIREILTASGDRIHPAFIEGVLDDGLCNNADIMCNQGKRVRQAINQQNQNIYSGGQINVRIGHATVNGTTLNFSTRCHDPIFVQVQFQTRAMPSTQGGNSTARTRTVIYKHQVGQYLIRNNNPASWGVTCNI